MKTINPQNAKFVAVVNDVKELRLIGEANLEFWNQQLANKPYQAFDKNSLAEITISVTELVWKGFRFHELTIFLTIAEKDNPTAEAGVFLVHALNSNRFFAFCERVFFSTPYYFGKINLRETIPSAMDAWANNQTVFKAEMNQTERRFIEENDDWEGAVFLPSAKGEKYFMAKLSGKSKVCPFDKSDKLEFNHDPKHEVFDLLLNSGFVGKEWRTRSEAFHAKSKTYSK